MADTQPNDEDNDQNASMDEENGLTIDATPLDRHATSLDQNKTEDDVSPLNPSTHSPQATTVINDNDGVADATANAAITDETIEEEEAEQKQQQPEQEEEEKKEQKSNYQKRNLPSKDIPEPDIFSPSQSIMEIPDGAKKYQVTGSFKTHWKEYVQQPFVTKPVKIHDWKAEHKDQGALVDTIFANPAAPRRVYVALKIKRISDIDNVRETYRCRFHVYFNWMLTETEYLNYLEYSKTNNADRKSEWYPPFIPRYEFLNIVEEHLREEEEYGREGKYRVQRITDFDKELIGFDPKNAFFVRMKLEMDATFCEELELESFPVDVQDFSVVMREGWGSHKAIFVPEIRTRKPKPEKKDGGGDGDGKAKPEKKDERWKPSDFARVDPSFSVLDEWEFHNSRIEFRSSVPSESRSETQYFMLTIRFKMRRKWSVYFWNVVLYMFFITLMSMSCFALSDANIAGERMALAVTLLLTAVAFQDVVTAELPHVAYLTLLHKYIICSFIFISLVAVQTAISAVDFIFENSDGMLDETRDTYERVSLAVFSFVFVAYNVTFLVGAAWLRHMESKKLFMDSQELALKVEMEKYQFKMKWQSETKDMTFGAKGQIASFVDTDPLLKSTAPEKDHNCCQFVFWWMMGGCKSCLTCACCKSQAKRRQEATDIRRSLHEMEIPADVAALGHAAAKSTDPRQDDRQLYAQSIEEEEEDAEPQTSRAQSEAQSEAP